MISRPEMDTRGGVNFDMAKLEDAVQYVCATWYRGGSAGRSQAEQDIVLLGYDPLRRDWEIHHRCGWYVKRQRGPVPKQVLPAIENLQRSGRLDVHNVSVFDLVRREFDALGKSNRGGLVRMRLSDERDDLSLCAIIPRTRSAISAIR